MKSKFQEYKFISGHFGYTFANIFIENRFSFTFLRDPVERIMSLYYYCRTKDPRQFEIYALSQQLEINNFLTLGFTDPRIKPYIWNHQVSQLTNGFASYQKSNIDEHELPKQALANLKNLSHVGFTKTFEVDRDIILKNLGIKPPRNKVALNTNSGRPTFSDLQSSTKDIILELTHLDRQLYNEAWANRRWSVNSILNKLMFFRETPY